MARRESDVVFSSTKSSYLRWPRQTITASVLLEVVLALALFVFAATVIAGGLSASVQETERLRLNVHASNLAVSVLSELQIGIRPVEAAGPEPFPPPFEMWTWQIQTTPLGDTFGAAASFQNVEVIIRHESRPIVRRLSQYLPTRIGIPATPPTSNGPDIPGANSAFGTEPPRSPAP